MKIRTIALLLIGSISTVSGQEFTSPRATSLGGYVAVANDAYGLDWNVSAQVFASTAVQMSFTKVNFEGGIHTFGLLVKVGDRHAVAVRKTPDFLTDVLFDKTPAPQTPDELTFYDLLSFARNQQDWAFGYAYKVSPHLAVGIEGRKYIFNNNLLGVGSASRYFGFGFAATYVINQRLQFGLVSRNTFSHHYKKHRDRIILQFEGEPDVRVYPLDLDAIPEIMTKPEWRLDFGVALHPILNLLLALDAYSDGGFGAGVEWEPFKGFYLRQGVNRKSDTIFKAEKLLSVAPGLGVRYGTAQLDVTFYKSWGRDIISTPVTGGDLHVRPNIGGDRIWLLSALFFVK